MEKYEKIHTIQDWWDGPLRGVVDYHGNPHIYTRVDEDEFQLIPISDEEFKNILEANEIWKRWVMAFEEGKTTTETHPCLPHERERYDELKKLTKSVFENERGTVIVSGIMREDPHAEKSKYYNHSFLSLEIMWGEIVP